MAEVISKGFELEEQKFLIFKLLYLRCLRMVASLLL